MAHLSRWMGTQGLGPTELGSRVMRFLAARRSAGHTRWVSERGLRSLVGYLVRSGQMPAPEAAVGESPTDRLLDAYGRYLAGERGLTTGTVAGYRVAVRPFVEERVHGDRLELGELSAADVTGFVLSGCRDRGVSSAKHLVTALRSLLRYLHLSGKAPDLAAAVPAVAGRRGGWVPRGGGAQRVGRVRGRRAGRTPVRRRGHTKAQ